MGLDSALTQHFKSTGLTQSVSDAYTKYVNRADWILQSGKVTEPVEGYVHGQRGVERGNRLNSSVEADDEIYRRLFKLPYRVLLLLRGAPFIVEVLLEAGYTEDVVCNQFRFSLIKLLAGKKISISRGG